MNLCIVRYIAIGAGLLAGTSAFTMQAHNHHVSNHNNNMLSSTSSSTEESMSTSTTAPFIDAEEEGLLEKSTFPIKPADLIQKAKEARNVAFGLRDNGACLADDFIFRAAVVGPLGKEEYFSALQTFDLEKSFDVSETLFGFQVDPVQPNRVYYMSRLTATQIAVFYGAEPDPEKLIEYPPQCFHVDFNEEGKVTELGFYTIDRAQGNTGGLGGAFGFFYAVGKALPIREAQPFKPSFRFRMLNFVGRMTRKMKGN